jgi:hypothetical protein
VQSEINARYVFKKVYQSITLDAGMLRELSDPSYDKDTRLLYLSIRNNLDILERLVEVQENLYTDLMNAIKNTRVNPL